MPSIRPAVITDEISQDFEHALDVMLEYGVRDAELRGLWGTNVMDLPADALDRAREALRNRGMRACSIASPAYKCHLFPEDASAAGAAGAMHLATERTLADQLPLLERAIGIARHFETALIRIFSFWRTSRSAEGIDDALLTAIVEGLLPGVRLAERHGIVLGLENEHACYLGTGAETVRALRAIDSPNLRAIWDPGNAFFAGERPFPEGYGELSAYLIHVHVKDAARNPEGSCRWTVVGDGEIDYRGQFRALASDGYHGLLSLETHYKPANGDPEEGSRACLAGMLAVMRECGILAA